MKQTYSVTGMTCNGCKVVVEDKLSSIAEVNSVSANIKKSEINIETRTHILMSDLQSVLSSKYQISEIGKINIFDTTASEIQTRKSDIKQLLPLFLIFGYITTASVLMNFQSGNISSFMLDFMGLFFIVFSCSKFLDYKGFPESFKMYDPLAKAIPVYAWLYPFVELALGLAFLNRFQIQITLIVTLIILGITTVGVAKALLNKTKIQCACLGTVLKLPMTKATFFENGIMLIMAVSMLAKIYTK